MRVIWDAIKTSIRYIKSLFLAGIFTLLPLAVTTIAIIFFYNLAYRFLAPFGIEDLLLITGGILFVGLLGKFIVAKAIVKPIERIIGSIPMVGALYSGLKALIDFFNPSGHPERKRQVVLVPHFKDDSYSLAFLFGPADQDFQQLLPNGTVPQGERMMKVFIPSNHIHFGFSVIMPESKIIPTEIRFEEAVKNIISGGIIIPSSLKKHKIKKTMAAAETDTLVKGA